MSIDSPVSAHEYLCTAALSKIELSLYCLERSCRSANIIASGADFMTPAEWLASIYARAVTAARTSTFRLLATICASSVFTVAGLLTYQTLQRRLTRKALRDSVEARFPASSRAASVVSKDEQLDDEVDDFLQPKGSLTRNASVEDINARAVDEEIIKEQLARNIAFLGEEAVAKIRTSFVVVVGLGGVGSAAGEERHNETRL